MNFTKLTVELEKIPKGVLFGIKATTDVPVTAKAKREGFKVYKTSSFVARKDIDTKKMKSVQMRLANTGKEVGELPWGEWKVGYEGLFLEHHGKTYLRLYPNTNRPRVQYFVNSVSVSKEELMNMGIVLNSYWNKKPNDIINIDIANISDITYTKKPKHN